MIGIARSLEIGSGTERMMGETPIEALVYVPKSSNLCGVRCRWGRGISQAMMGRDSDSASARSKLVWLKVVVTAKTASPKSDENMNSWFPKSTVLIPVDFSAPALEAINAAREMVANDSGLHVLHVISEHMPVPVEGAWVPPPIEEDLQGARSGLKRKLDELGAHQAVSVVRVGSPASVICEYAKEIGAELIVIPSHGRTGIKHLLIGSVAERVARHASCPVLIMRRNEP